MKKVYQYTMCLVLIALGNQLLGQTDFEISVATNYVNLRNKAQDTYMRPQNGWSNVKIHQWEIGAEEAASDDTYKFELRPATTTGYYYFINKSTGQMAKPTGETIGDASMDASFTLDAGNKDNDFFMYTLEEVSGDPGFYHIKNKGSGYYIRPSGGGNDPDGAGPLTRNDVQIRHQSNTTPTFQSYRWEIVPVEIVGANKWDGSSWSKAVPPRYSNVEINGDYSLAGDGTFESNNLTVAASTTLTIETGETLVVHGFLANEGGTIVVESGGSLITKGGVSGTGYTISRNTTFNSSTNRYSVIGSPVSGATTSVLGNLVYSYDESVAYGSGGTERFSEVTTSETMTAGDAYFSSASGTVTFTGTPNTGQVDVSLIYNSGADGGNAGFNLVSNPYPTAISYDEFVALNVTSNSVITGTIYLWDDGGSDASQRTNADYITANSMGSASAGSGRSADWNGYIGSAQGFFVKATTAGTLSFTDDMKVSGNNEDGAFFRTSGQSTFPTAKLMLTNKSTGASIETLVGLSDDATIGVDPLYDAEMISGTNGVRFYSLIDGNPYTIQGVPEQEQVISLGIELSGEGEQFSLSLSGLKNWPEDTPIFLYDRSDDVYIPLEGGSTVNFSAEQGIFNHRFELYLGDRMRVLKAEAPHSLPVKYKSEGIVVHGVEPGAKADILIHDISGKTHLKKSFEIGNDRMIPFSFNRGQVYVVRIEYENEVIIDKILIQ